jgi:hypothetical protein
MGEDGFEDGAIHRRLPEQRRDVRKSCNSLSYKELEGGVNGENGDIGNKAVAKGAHLPVFLLHGKFLPQELRNVKRFLKKILEKCKFLKKTA